LGSSRIQSDTCSPIMMHVRSDSALIDELASARRVVAFDNAGVGGSAGTTPHAVEQMAYDAIAFITAMGFTRADILGFSIGSFVAQETALIRPAHVGGLILVSAAARARTDRASPLRPDPRSNRERTPAWQSATWPPTLRSPTEDRCRRSCPAGLTAVQGPASGVALTP
jgi:pimeloyl-ACP methyl ester carboxylesterase